jgi:cyclic 2,3-diphosphoglycerate synthetase
MDGAAGLQAGDGALALALIDGEHYPDVIVAALSFLEDTLRYRLAGIVFLGGTEKLPDLDRFSYRDVPVFAGGGQEADLRRALARTGARVVLDLSDEPVLGYVERFRLVSEALARGASYRGADFYFEAPERPDLCDKPSIGVWGSGKRVGKTALAGYMARHLASRGTRPCICTMGRGGPPEPELLSEPSAVTDAYLRDRVAAGCHAASDHFEDAMMGEVIAVGCRRCGGGMAGAPFYSNVREGAALACAQNVDLVIFEGSGAAIPPVGVDAVLLATAATQPLDYLLGYLGPYRLLLSDLLVVTMCEEFQVSSEKLRKLIDGVLSINPEVKVVKTVFRPRPLGDLCERKVYLASTAPPEGAKRQAEHLAREYGALIVGSSPNLADRARLAADLAGARDAEVLVTELKAAGVDTVSLFARDNDKEIVYLENQPVALDAGDLGEEIDHLEAAARARFTGR